MVLLKKGLIAVFLCVSLFAINEIVAFAENSPPETGEITPIGGESQPGEQVIFTATCSDADGWEDIIYTFLRIKTPSLSEYFSGFYKPKVNKLFLYKQGTGWIGGFAPGSQETLENNVVIVDCANTTVETQGDTLTVNWAVAFKEFYKGQVCDVQLRAGDIAGLDTGWVDKGTWSIVESMPGIPRTLRFQGMLKDDGGAPIDGSVILTFRLYDSADGGEVLWEEVQPDVYVENGLLDVELGSGDLQSEDSLEDLGFDKQYWLSVQIEPDTEEMHPRFKFTSVPYAIKAE